MASTPGGEKSALTVAAIDQKISRYLMSLYSLKGKTALITGGTRGLGRQIALALTSAGADLILLVRNPSDPTVGSLVSLVEGLGRKVVVREADLLVRESYLDTIEGLFEGSGPRPDIFIHSAGLQHREPSVQFPQAKWDQILEVNLTAGFLISQALAQHWIPKADDTKPTAASHKTIVFVASVLSQGPGSHQIPAYVSTKGSISQLVKTLSNEWSQHSINVNAVAPGYFETELTKGIREVPEEENRVLGRVPMGRWGKARGKEDEEGDLGDLEGVVVWLCGRGGEFVAGETVVVDGGFSGR